LKVNIGGIRREMKKGNKKNSIVDRAKSNIVKNRKKNINRLNKIYDFCLKLSEQIGKAVIVSSHDKYYTIFSIFANAKHLKNETKVKLYIKHTMCHTSCFDFQDYTDVASELFKPIIYKGYSIGMTICYDCNHALFSRIYGMYGVDLIINSTGGNVIYDKWFKYNKVRAIENNCYILVTMGGDDKKDNNYVLGFNKNGGLLYPKNPYGDSSKHNNPGGLYLYEVKRDAGKPEEDYSNKYETDNKNEYIDISFALLKVYTCNHHYRYGAYARCLYGLHGRNGS